MQRSINCALVLLLVFSAMLLLCSGCSAPSGGKCAGGICIDLELAEPIRMNEPIKVTITVEAEKDVENLSVSLWFSDPDILVDGGNRWTIDAEAHVPVQSSTSIRFTQRGYYDVVAGVLDSSGRMIRDYVSVNITTLGGTLNPESKNTFGTPAPAERLDITPPIPTPISLLATPVLPSTTPQSPRAFDATSFITVAVSTVAGHQDLSVPIPEDGTWLSYTFPITVAPTRATTTTNVSVKFLIGHPRPQDLIAEIVGPDGTTTYQLPGHIEPGPKSLHKDSWVLNAYNILLFEGQPVNAEWTLRIRDTKRGQKGQLLALSVAVGYLQSSMNPVPVPLSRFSAEEAVLTTVSGWQQIVNQTFEGAFPATGWDVADLSADGYTRYWDDDDYKPHQSNWAAWPANGGLHGITPTSGNDNYPNNMNARMIYGPFDLSDAVLAEVDFVLWREIEANYDYLAFEVSHDGIAFQELRRWSDEDQTFWEHQKVYLDAHTGDNSVWVAWRFYSDSSIAREGPWIDDITIQKYVPGQVAPQGWFYFYDRDDLQTPARTTRVHLYDADLSSEDDLLSSSILDINGFWQMGPLTNWDVDASGPLDLYVVFETDVEDVGVARQRVTNFNDWAYKWQIYTQNDVTDGVVDFGAWVIGDASDWEPAMWVFQDLQRAREYVYQNTSNDPGPVAARWEKDKTSLLCSGSCQFPYPPVNGIFISHGYLPQKLHQ